MQSRCPANIAVLPLGRASPRRGTLTQIKRDLKAAWLRLLRIRPRSAAGTLPYL
jgi:hypothetical protein